MPSKDWGLLSLGDTLSQTVSLRTFVRKSVLFSPLQQLRYYCWKQEKISIWVGHWLFRICDAEGSWD